MLKRLEAFLANQGLNS